MVALVRRVLIAVLLLGVGAPRAALAEEACAATSAQLQDDADQAWSDYGSLDEDGFRAATDQMRAHMACLVEPITRDLAASVHRLVGLRAATDDQKDLAALAFAAARSIEPRWRFPESLFPKGHPLRALYEAFPLDLATWAALGPSSAVVRLDGRTADSRPTAWPTIVQVFSADGAVLSSAYLWPEDPMIPLPPPVAGLPPLTQLEPPRAPDRSGPRWVLLGVAAASAGASAILYASADATADDLRDRGVSPAHSETMRARANGLVLGSAGAGVVAVGVGTVALLQVRW